MGMATSNKAIQNANKYSLLVQLKREPQIFNMMLPSKQGQPQSEITSSQTLRAQGQWQRRWWLPSVLGWGLRRCQKRRFRSRPRPPWKRQLPSLHLVAAGEARRDSGLRQAAASGWSVRGVPPHQAVAALMVVGGPIHTAELLQLAAAAGAQRCCGRVGWRGIRGGPPR